MSYATSLLMAYPPPYGPSTLLSDDLVQLPSYGTFYEPSLSYRNSSRLFSDDLPYNHIGFGQTSYRSSIYSHFPSTNYRSPSVINWRRDIIPPQNSYPLLNEIREYSESLGTASNSNTASSIAYSINDNNLNGPMNIFPNYQQNYNRLLKSPHRTTIWSPSRYKLETNDEKRTPTQHSIPELSPTIIEKKSPIEESNKDTTLVPPSVTKEENNSTLIEIKKRESSIDTSTWLSENKDETSTDDKIVEQTLTNKIDQLHTIQAQHEKEKTKSSHVLPSISKTFQNKSNDNTSLQTKNDSYFDSIFDGNFFRKTSTNQQNSSYQQSLSRRNKPTTNIFNKPKTKIFPKHISPQNTSRYEPPSSNRVPPTITTSSWRKQLPKQNQSGSVTSRESIHKDDNERYREALHKFRSDRAEQQQKELNDSTAKRLHYGDYVRRSTKDGLLPNIIKPLPWSDFMDLKKGNLYSLTKQEKKDRYNQSKSYGERVRYRNYALHQIAETNRTKKRPSIFFPVPNLELQSDDENNYLKRPESSSTIRTTHKTYDRDIMFNRVSRTTNFSNRSSTIRSSEEEDIDLSDFESSRQQKKNLYFSTYNSFAKSTSRTEESENDQISKQQSTRTKHQDIDNDIRKEKSLELSENERYRKQ